MTEVEKEKAITGYPIPVTIEGTINILNQLQNCICKIENKNGSGTGFFCYIPYKNEKKKVLITNNHVIDEDILKEKKNIRVSINEDKENILIELTNKKIYTSKKYDTTIIEINSKNEKINNYLEIDENIFSDNLFNKSIYILQYPKFSDGQKAAVSYGIIKNIQDEYNIIHYCCTETGSSGSPIINLLNNKIIGIHKESVKNKNFNRGSLLKYPIDEYIQYLNKKNNNEINLTIRVEKEDIDNSKKIYFLNYDDSLSHEKEYLDSITYYNTLLNESKIEIYLNNNKYKNKRFFKPETIGEYKIKLIFKLDITNMSHMFFGCHNLIYIDLSSFDTKNATNMSNMFSYSGLNDIDLSYFDTQNVTNMSRMFCSCTKLTKIDLSSFNTHNVKDMSYMFDNSFNLTNIILSSFDTRNVTNMEGMFVDCGKLPYIDLSSFDTRNVNKMDFIVGCCENLKRVKINDIITNKNLKKELIEKYSYINIIDKFNNKINC